MADSHNPAAPERKTVAPAPDIVRAEHRAMLRTTSCCSGHRSAWLQARSRCRSPIR